VQALAARDDRKGVLQLVHAWRLAGRPTLASRVLEGRALLELRLVDRAIARARECVEEAPAEKAAMRLLAESYIERGWPLRARPVLESLRAAGEAVDSLVARTAEDPVRPETMARDVEAGDAFDQLLQLAERFLATGSPTRARGLLDRLARRDPTHRRVQELLWGLGGEFASAEPLEAMVRRSLPVMADLAAVPEEAEHTESLRSEVDFLMESEEQPAAFPSLFKRAASALPVPATPLIGTPNIVARTRAADGAGSGHDHDDASHEEEERTASSSVAAGPHLVAVTGSAVGDTQILRVVGADSEAGEGATGDGALHRRREGEAQILNLRDWQASMGVDPVGSDLDDIGMRDLDSEVAPHLLDGETPLVEAVAGAPAPSEPARTFAAPIEVIEKHPVPVNDPPTLDPEPLEPRRGMGIGKPLLGLAFVGVVGLLFLLLAGLLARAVGLLDVARTSVDLDRTLASADWPALVEAERRLDSYATSPGQRAELARARLVLWDEFDGTQARLAKVDALLESPNGVDAHRLAYLRAAELLAFRNPASALAAIGREPAENDDEHLLLARIHSALGDHSAAASDLAGVKAPKQPRYQLARAELLAAAGERDEARDLVAGVVASSPTLVAARLAELKLREGTPQERATAAEVFRKTYGGLGLSPRQYGEAAWQEAQAWMEAGDRARALKAAEAGVSRDGTHRDLLLMLALADLEAGDLVGATKQLGPAQDLYRADPELRAALALVDADLDRVEQARTLAAEANPPLREVLTGYIAAWAPSDEAPDPASVSGDDPLAQWTRALLAVNASRADAPLLSRSAAEALATAPELWIRRLAPRAEALAATLLDPPEAAARVSELRRSGVGDAGAHVFLGRYHERLGARALAAQHFDRAVELEPELALAQYERGRFYADASDPQRRTSEAWTAYLALAPSGPRAERVKASPLLRLH
jgi:predicted Zn-dependent protease